MTMTEKESLLERLKDPEYRIQYALDAMREGGKLMLQGLADIDTSDEKYNPVPDGLIDRYKEKLQNLAVYFIHRIDCSDPESLINVIAELNLMHYRETGRAVVRWDFIEDLENVDLHAEFDDSHLSKRQLRMMKSLTGDHDD